jgi:putative SOS response-associated peptidase YedK
MCGRFALFSPAETIAEQFDLAAPPPLAARYNIAPTQPVLAIRAGGNGQPQAAFFQWGLIPAWDKELRMAGKLINARSETAAEKPSFRAALRYRRCIIPADGFYEWQKVNGRKQPHFIGRRDERPLAIAAIWEHWQGADGSEFETCALLTTSANALMRPLHERMPVLLEPEDYGLWLDTAVQKSDQIQHLLRPYPADLMRAYPVSTHVNNARNDDPRCIEAAS